MSLYFVATLASDFFDLTSHSWTPYLSVSSPLLLIFPILWFGIFARVPETVALHLPEFSRKEDANTKLIVFLHGWTGDRATTWNRFPQLVLEDPIFHNCDVLSLAYPTFMVRRNLYIPQLVSWLLRQLNANSVLDKYDAVAIVAHSMGGLIARELVIQSRLGQNTTKIRGIVAIGTPHQGAKIATLAKEIGISRGFARSLAPGSEFLASLAVYWNGLEKPPETYGIGSPHDGVVSLESAHFLCAMTDQYPMFGHR